MRNRYLKYLLLIFCGGALTGCYNRWNSNYDEFPDLVSSRNAIVDESGMSAEDRQRRMQFLEELAAEPEPEYRINAGDFVEIRVYNHDDLSIKTMVTPDGHIGMVFIGQVEVAGLTLQEAADKLEGLLSRYIKNPEVGISPQEIRSQTASIAGAVTHPGMYTISNGMRLADLFAKAGGSSARYYDGQTLDAADLKNSVFIRNGEIIPVDFSLAIESGDRLNNILLRKGDYIYIAVRSESMVCLIGDVPNPHKRLWDNNLGLLELLTTGGWVNETYWPYAIIIRGGVANPTMYKVDIDGILHGRKPNVMLEAGDVVYIPKDDISEYNVFVRKLMPTAQLVNLLTSPVMWWVN